MADLESLARRARTSGDGEALLPIAKGPGLRVAVGARAGKGPDPDFFVEVVLDPFPERPDVNPERFGSQGAIVERLRRRGYSLNCDDAGILTCERTIGRSRIPREIREQPRMLEPRPKPKHPRPRDPMTEPS